MQIERSAIPHAMTGTVCLRRKRNRTEVGGVPIAILGYRWAEDREMRARSKGWDLTGGTTGASLPVE